MDLVYSSMSKPKSQQKQALPSNADEPIQLSINEGKVISALPFLLLSFGNRHKLDKLTTPGL